MTRGGARPPAVDLPHALATFVADALGGIAFAARAAASGTDHRVWAIEAADGRRLHLKAHGPGRQHDQEARAYARWAAPLGAAAPRLVAADRAERALLIATAPGRPLAEAAASLAEESLRRAVEAAAHREAGRALARLHAIAEPDRDPIPLGRALAARAARWAERARARVEPAAIGGVVDAVTEPGLFEGARRVPCHRDFGPHNWLVEVVAPDADAAPGAAPDAASDAAGKERVRLVVIDFGHARLDLALGDLAKLAAGAWRGRKDLEDAFFAGYGRRLDSRERRQLAALVRLHALATCAWGSAHGNRRFEDEGRALLAGA